jgi:hypothetical protein
MEYEVYYLDATMRRCHIGEKLYESDDLADASTMTFILHRLLGAEVCVWQPRHKHYREIYRNN